MKKVYVAIFACLLFAFSSGVASSEIVDSTTTPTQSSTESAIKIERVWTESQQAAVTHPLNSTGKEDIKATATIGDAIYIYLNNTEATQRFLKTPKNRIMLYLNDSPLATVHPETIDSISCWLKFQLARNDSNQNAWAIILGSPNLRKLGTSLFVPYFDSVRVSIGKEGAFPETSYGKLPLTRMFLGGAWIFFLLFVAAVPLGCWATYKYKLLRVPRSQITMEAVDESNIFDPDKYSYPEDELVSEKIKIVSNLVFFNAKFTRLEKLNADSSSMNLMLIPSISVFNINSFLKFLECSGP